MTNYFSLLKIRPQFMIEEKELKNNLKNEQKIYHPDKFVLANEAQKKEAELHSALLNQAYKILLNFKLRLKHLFELNGIELNENQNQLPQEFLFEMMEINETCELLCQENKMVELKSNLETLYEKLIKNETLLLQSFPEELTSEDWQRIKNLYFKMNYIVRMKENFLKDA